MVLRCAVKFGNEWFLGSDRNFAAKRGAAPEGRAAGSGNLGSDPENRSRFLGMVPESSLA